MGSSTLYVTKPARRSLLYSQGSPGANGSRSHVPPRTRETWASVKRQFEASPSGRVGVGDADDVGDEGVGADGVWVVGVDAAESPEVRASPEHPAASKAATRVAATWAPRSFGIASP